MVDGDGLGVTAPAVVLLVHAVDSTATAASTMRSLRIQSVNGRAAESLRGIVAQVFKPDEEVWKRFLQATRGQPAWGRLIKAASMFETPGDALDVGAGGGRDTAHLLKLGWRVTAVDASPAASEILRMLEPQANLRVVTSAAQDFEPASYDLVNAQFSLPFVPPAFFATTVRRLNDAVRPAGVMAVTFFGPRDEWNVAGSELTFTTRQEVERWFQGWETIELTEIEEDGTTATGGAKHWDVIHVIARKRA